MSTKLPLTKARLGVIHLFIKRERWTDDAVIPSYPVETGLDITDHVEDKANVLVIEGVLFTDRKLDYVEKLRLIRKYKDEGRVLNFKGKRSNTNFLISNFVYESDSTISNGQEFTLTLKEVRFAKKAVVTKKKAAKGKTSSGKQQTQGKNSGGTKYHITKKGDTYIGLGKKYGTPWRDIKKWAGYPDRRIPIGVKVRVK